MKKIIVIDDDQTILTLLKKSLAKEGYEVITAEDGVEGFFYVKNEKPDLIILDIHMPNVDGYQMIRDIQAQEDLKDMPVIVMTADNTLEDKFRDVGISHYVTKPFDMIKFLAYVRITIDKISYS